MSFIKDIAPFVPLAVGLFILIDSGLLKKFFKYIFSKKKNNNIVEDSSVINNNLDKTGFKVVEFTPPNKIQEEYCLIVDLQPIKRLLEDRRANEGTNHREEVYRKRVCDKALLSSFLNLKNKTILLNSI